MTQDQFKKQIARLTVKFGPRAFDTETCKLMYAEVKGLLEDDLSYAVDTWLGRRKHTNPPMVDDFVQIRKNRERKSLEREAVGASRSLNRTASERGLKEFLARNYRGARSIWEAVQIRVHQNKIKESEGGADDPEGAA